MMKRTVTVVLAILVFACAAAPALADVLPSKYRIEPVLRGLNRAEAVAFAPDGRVFIAERTTGKLLVMKHGKLLATPFVQLPVATGSEEGLLGVTVHPDFAANGWVYVFYTQASPKTNRIVRYTASGDLGTGAFVVLDNIGAAGSGEDNGGALMFGADGKLYAGIGVFGADGDAQLDTSLAGKVLRINADGTVPADNPNPGASHPYSLIWAKGFRDPADLAQNAGVGTVYGTDRYDSDAACDETNVVAGGGNYGWSAASCGNGGHNPPLEAISPQPGVNGIASYTGGKFPGYENSAFVSGSGGTIRHEPLTGAAFDTLGAGAATFYDPASDADCPAALSDLGLGRDGWLYATSASTSGSVSGLYRVLYDGFGGTAARPREVSATPYVPLTIERNGGGLKLYWEDLKADAWACTDLDGTGSGTCASGSKTNKYAVWQGELTAPFAYGHSVVGETNGTDVSDALLSYDIATAPTGNKYFLVSARGANFEGPTGFDSAGGERPGATSVDICGAAGGIPIGGTINKCVGSWPHTFPDQTNTQRSITEFRGKTVFFSFAQFG